MNKAGRLIMTIKFSPKPSDDAFCVEDRSYRMRHYEYGVVACEIIRADDTGTTEFETADQLGNSWINSN